MREGDLRLLYNRHYGVGADLKGTLIDESPFSLLSPRDPDGSHQPDRGHETLTVLASPPTVSCRPRRSRGLADSHQGSAASEPLLTPRQILDLANISMRSFRRWTASGELEVVRLGRSVRVRPSAWAAFLRKQSHKS